MSIVTARLRVLAALSVLLLPLVGCLGGAALVSNQSVSTGLSSQMLPRWVCPSPTPLPTRAKEPSATGTPSAWYAPWEQEYGLPPMTPTPYFSDGTAFHLGQVVELSAGVFVEPTVQASNVVSGTEHIYLVTLRWTNQTTGTLALNPARQVVISSITKADGHALAGSWLWTPVAAQLAGLPTDAALVATVPPGQSTQTLPIAAPAGVVAVLDIRLDPPGAVDGASAGGLRVQFTPGEPAPPCTSAGVIGANLIAPHPTAVGVAPPTNSDAIVAAALAQVGQQYCWGGKGFTPCDGFGGGSYQVTPACAQYPCFDCSGLTWWAYNANGITIGHGTSNQQQYPVVDLANAADGDIALFAGVAGSGRSGITHAGLLADVDHNGTLDIIHATQYPDGVVISYNIFTPGSWYLTHLVMITRPPRSSGA